MKLYYTYVYLNPLKPGNYNYDSYSWNYEPFYVGYGKGKRYLDHMLPCRYQRTKNKTKISIITEIFNAGKEPIIIKVIKNEEKLVAINEEIKLISLIGRLDKKTGPLSNMSNGGELSITDGKEVLQYNIDGDFVHSYKSKKEVFYKFNIRPAINTYKESFGYIWFYAEYFDYNYPSSIEKDKIHLSTEKERSRLLKYKKSCNNRQLYIFNYENGDFIKKGTSAEIGVFLGVKPRTYDLYLHKNKYLVIRGEYGDIKNLYDETNISYNKNSQSGNTKNKKAIEGVDSNGNIQKYECIMLAVKAGYDRSRISKSIKSGGIHKGLRWRIVV